MAPAVVQWAAVQWCSAVALAGEPTSNVYQPLVDEIVGGRRNIFLTGRAGTGKTTLLRQLIFNSLDKAIVLAPTGLAAVNVGGQTIHSFFNFPPRLLDGGMHARSATSAW